MALAAIARKDADIAADKAHCLVAAYRTYRGRLLGHSIANSDFADEQRGRAVTQAQARRVLNGERAIRVTSSGSICK